MNANIKQCHPETTKILTNARAALENGEITNEQYNDVVMMCIAAETEWAILAEDA